MINKVLVIIVTKDNPIMLQHMFESFDKFDPGYPCDFLIVDHESKSQQHFSVLENISKKANIVSYENDRVEVSFNKAYWDNKDYEYYFFMHDDAGVNQDNWLKIFIDRLKSNFYEKIISNTHLKNLPIGRVGACSQPWRSYSSMSGFPVQCLFLEKVLELLRNLSFPEKYEIPSIFKFCDPDRVLISNECMKATGLIYSLEFFNDLPHEEFDLISKSLNEYLKYPDEGIPPRDKYPAGSCWNKLTMTSEFFNSVMPLIRGYRTVGLDGDGFLEQINGYDVPWGHKVVHHYGSPNMCQFVAKFLNTDPEEVKKNLKNKVLLMRIDKMLKEYHNRKI